jgi:hypothetical protein
VELELFSHLEFDILMNSLLLCVDEVFLFAFRIWVNEILSDSLIERSNLNESLNEWHDNIQNDVGHKNITNYFIPILGQVWVSSSKKILTNQSKITKVEIDCKKNNDIIHKLCNKQRRDGYSSLRSIGSLLLHFNQSSNLSLNENTEHQDDNSGNSRLVP